MVHEQEISQTEVGFDSIRLCVPNVRCPDGHWHSKLQYPHTNSSHWSPYISSKDKLREFDKILNQFPFIYHFLFYSPNLCS